MIAFMSQYWWRTIYKATEIAYLLTPLVWNTAQKNLFVLLPVIFNCLMNNSRSVKWIFYNFLCVTDINIFNHGLCVFILVWNLPSQTGYCFLLLLWLKFFFFFFFFENDISTWETPFNFHGDWGSHFTGLLRQVCVVLLVLQHFHCTNNPQSSGLAECTNGIKTLMETFVEVLQIPWSKALPFSLLNLRSTIFGELIKFHPLR